MANVDWRQALSENDRWLRMLAWARVGERAAVDEVMQEVALAAMRQQAPLDDAAKVGPWLYRLAVRQALLYRRKAGRRRRLAERFAQECPRVGQDGAESDPLAWLLADERRALVRTGLRRVPRRDAEILLLKYTEDWSYRQLAEKMGISESAVEARLFRARGRLRTALATLDVAAVNS